MIPALAIITFVNRRYFTKLSAVLLSKLGLPLESHGTGILKPGIAPAGAGALFAILFSVSGSDSGVSGRLGGNGLEVGLLGADSGRGNGFGRVAMA